MKTINQNKMELLYVFIGYLIILVVVILPSCTVVKTNFSNEAKKEATIYYYLPESLVKVRATTKVAVVYGKDSILTGSSYIVEQSFTVTTEIIADTKNLLSLNYKPNPLMADEVKFSVNSKGLLETVDITTEDRTANIISKLAEAPQIILGNSTGESKGDEIVEIKEFVSDFEIKASDISNVVKLVYWNLTIYNELGKSDKPKVVPANFSLCTTSQVSQSTFSDLINADNDSKNTEIDGILTRPIKNIPIEIKSEVDGTNFNSTLPLNIPIADVTKLIVIPVKRAAFVKRVNKIGIQDGVILSNEINNPSSVEGFISIPINVAKAVVSIPGQLVQFRYDNIKREDELEKAKLSYEKSLQESQKFALTKEQEIEKVKLEIEKSNLSNSLELQKLKLELQTSLLEAEKKLLETQKSLDEIKKALEELKQKK